MKLWIVLALVVAAVVATMFGYYFLAYSLVCAATVVTMVNILREFSSYDD